MFQKLRASCSHAFLVGVSKKGLFSPPPPPLFQPRRRGVEWWWEDGTDPPPSFTEELRHSSLCKCLPHMWTERSDWCQPKWAVYKMAALTRQWGLRAVALREEMDQILNCISQAWAATAPSPFSSTEIKYSFLSGPPEVASNYIQICSNSYSLIAVYLFALLNPI